MFGNHCISYCTWERTTITYTESKKHKFTQDAENKSLRTEILKLKDQIENLKTENKDLKQRLKNINKQKSITQVDYKRSSSAPKFSLLSKIKNTLDISNTQNVEHSVIISENIK